MSGTSLYETDLALWSQTQVRLLREAAGLRGNEAIDWENLAEEIETLGRSQASALVSRLARVIEHLLKLQFSPAGSPRRVWEQSVRAQRLRVDFLLRASPSLRGRLGDFLGDAAELGTTYALRSLVRHQEEDAILTVRAHGGRYSVEQVIGDWLPPAPPTD